MRRTYNDVLVELRNARASGDADAVARLKAERDQWPTKERSRKPRTDGQSRYVGMLKRNGWL